jgi:hypothetical protein
MLTMALRRNDLAVAMQSSTVPKVPEAAMASKHRTSFSILTALTGIFMFTGIVIAGPQSTPGHRPASAPVYANDAPTNDSANAPQSQPPDSQPAPGHELYPADGRRQPGTPSETYAVAPGTKFLARLEDDLSSATSKENTRFRMTTLEPLDAGNGIYLPAGAEIEGRVTRVEAAGVAGRAKLWLTFDYLRTRFGKLPLVAEVSSIPGDHSAKSTVTKEGLIEGRSSTQKDAEQAAAAAAAIGAVKGVKDKDKKEAAEGAAMAAFTAYLAESGRGHDLTFPKGVKFELELERSLYLLKE